MSRLSRKVRLLQRRNSRSHIFILFVFLLIVGGMALAARLYALAPIKIMDSSMTPRFKEHSIHWMCKLPQCLGEIQDRDIVWVKLRNGETMVRGVLAMPGDSIEITDKGIVRTPHGSSKWEGENAFIQSRSIYVPRSGDTLSFDRLNDAEQDYAISYLRGRGEKVAVKSTLWQGEREINIDRVGSTKIANRQVSLKEINFLPWQDRYLIEQQIRLSEPGNAPIKIRRELFYLKPPPKPTLSPPQPAPDSGSTTADTVADSSKAEKAPETSSAAPEDIYGEPIHEIVIDRDCYFLACTRGESCPDSREMGYFTQEDMVGKYILWPDRFKNKVIIPIQHYATRALDYALSLFVPEEENAESSSDKSSSDKE